MSHRQSEFVYVNSKTGTRVKEIKQELLSKRNTVRGRRNERSHRYAEANNSVRVACWGTQSDHVNSNPPGLAWQTYA
jgi:hypothetical protein